MSDPAPPETSRTSHADRAILTAFAGLVFERRYDAIRVSDLVAAAGVGRATFYEHFRNKDAVLVASMEPVLLALCAAATGRASRAYVRNTLAHLWQRRSTGRTILNSAASRVLQRRLAELIRLRLEQNAPQGAAPAIRAAGIAAAQIAMLHSWLAGEASCSAEAMADQIVACAALTA